MASSLTRTSRQENSALLLGGLGFLVGAAFGLVLLRPHSAIFGQGSVANWARSSRCSAAASVS